MEVVVVIRECCQTVPIPILQAFYRSGYLLPPQLVTILPSATWSLRFGLCQNAGQSVSGSSTLWPHGRCCNDTRVFSNCSHTYIASLQQAWVRIVGIASTSTRRPVPSPFSLLQVGLSDLACAKMLATLCVALAHTDGMEGVVMIQGEQFGISHIP